MKRNIEKLEIFATIGAALGALLASAPSCFDLLKKHFCDSPLVVKIFTFFNDNPWMVLIYIALLLTALFFALVLPSYRLRKFESYHRLKTSEKLSHSTFLALQDANRNKTREIMRYTYGEVGKWDHINYFRNLLMYDIHEQIRYILISLRDLIINNDRQHRFDKDNITVDLLFSYGDFKTTNLKSTDDKRIRFISSGDNDCSLPIKRYLYRSDSDVTDSFYSFVDNNNEGFLFLNDKFAPVATIDREAKIVKTAYIRSKKDTIYFNIEAGGNRFADKPPAPQGSIIGMVFYLPNDEPNNILVKAILTITTYGNKIFDGKAKDLKWFVGDFYSKVLCSYKSLLISELSQMYIRHEVKSGQRNPVTGESIKIEAEDRDKHKEHYDRLIKDVEEKVNDFFKPSDSMTDSAESSAQPS